MDCLRSCFPFMACGINPGHNSTFTLSVPALTLGLIDKFEFFSELAGDDLQALLPANTYHVTAI